MTKKTILLFLKAFIIGLILNIGVQQASKIDQIADNEPLLTPQIELQTSQTPLIIKTNRSDQSLAVSQKVEAFVRQT